MIKRFTGWHMTVVFVAFFGVVVGVNLTMANYAIATFGGTVVENSYVASQNYNRWLAQARRQKELGWTPRIDAGADRHITIAITTPHEGMLTGATVVATATHPLGALPPKTLSFVAGPKGYRSLSALPEGRWLLRIAVTRGKATASFDDEIGA
jgi:nitrogen fixation protein FixH